ncbi:MAG: hypothetical protein ACRCUJ_03460 [Phocaeicola sp.]
MKTKQMSSVKNYRIPMNYFHSLGGWERTNIEYRRLVNYYAEVDWSDVAPEELSELIRKVESSSITFSAEAAFLRQVALYLEKERVSVEKIDASQIGAGPMANLDKIEVVQMKGEPLRPSAKKRPFFKRFWK